MRSEEVDQASSLDLYLQAIADEEEAAALMRLLAQRGDPRLREQIGRLDIEPLEQAIKEQRAHLLSLLGQSRG